jgi:hypothetical protein
MGRGRRWTGVRAVGLLGGSAAAAGSAWWLSGDLLRPVVAAWSGRGLAGIAALSFEQALDATCAAVLLGCVWWLSLGTALAVVSYAATSLSPSAASTAALETLVDRGCPRRLRRLVLACLGVAIGATGPALADPPGVTDRPGAHGSAADGISGLPLPDRTTGSPPALQASPAARSAPAPGAHRPREPEGTVLVRPGDSLWTIAADLLPASASDRAVTVAWHRLHEVNRGRIGRDPDLIHPGTRLGIPEQLPTEREERG